MWHSIGSYSNQYEGFSYLFVGGAYANFNNVYDQKHCRFLKAMGITLLTFIDLPALIIISTMVKLKRLNNRRLTCQLQFYSLCAQYFFAYNFFNCDFVIPIETSLIVRRYP